MKPDFLKKVLLCTFFLFLQGCTKTFTWELDEVYSRCPEFDSGRLRSVKKPSCSGLELELIRAREEDRLYLNIHGLPLSPEPIKIIQATVDQHSYEIEAYLMEGGQRLLLDEAGTQLILDTLWDEQPVILSIFPYSKEFLSDNFPDLYQKL